MNWPLQRRWRVVVPAECYGVEWVRYFWTLGGAHYFKTICCFRLPFGKDSLPRIERVP